MTAICVVLVVVASAMFLGGIAWASKRGDELMGIGDSQGRENEVPHA